MRCQAGLLASGSSYSPGLPILKNMDSGVVGLLSPATAAGPLPSGGHDALSYAKTVERVHDPRDSLLGPIVGA